MNHSIKQPKVRIDALIQSTNSLVRNVTAKFVKEHEFKFWSTQPVPEMRKWIAFLQAEMFCIRCKGVKWCEWLDSFTHWTRQKYWKRCLQIAKQLFLVNHWPGKPSWIDWVGVIFGQALHRGENECKATTIQCRFFKVVSCCNFVKNNATSFPLFFCQCQWFFFVNLGHSQRQAGTKNGIWDYALKQITNWWGLFRLFPVQFASSKSKFRWRKWAFCVCTKCCVRSDWLRCLSVKYIVVWNKQMFTLPYSQRWQSFRSPSQYAGFNFKLTFTALITFDNFLKFKTLSCNSEIIRPSEIMSNDAL